MEIDKINWEPKITNTQEALLELMKATGDLLRLLSNHFLWDEKYIKYVHPFAVLAGSIGLKSREFLPPHKLWDLTNDENSANSLKRAMGYDENGNKIDQVIDPDWDE